MSKLVPCFNCGQHVGIAWRRRKVGEKLLTEKLCEQCVKKLYETIPTYRPVPNRRVRWT